MVRLDVERSSRLYHEARELLRKGDREAAIRALRDSLQASPHFKTAEVLGECLLEAGALSESLLYLSASVGLGRNQSRGLFLMAKAYVEAGDESAAYVKLSQALEMNSNFKAARELHGLIAARRPDIAQYWDPEGGPSPSGSKS